MVYKIVISDNLFMLRRSFINNCAVEIYSSINIQMCYIFYVLNPAIISWKNNKVLSYIRRKTYV